MITDKNILSRAAFGYVLGAFCANNIICGFSTREFNYDLRAVSSPLAKQEILRNRQNLFESLSLNIHKSVFMEQVHEAKIKTISNAEQGMGACDYESSITQTDAVITSLSETPLCMLSADCFPLVFWHPSESVIGIAHAGWRGLKERIAFKTAIRLQKTYKCPPEKIKVFVAPGIRVCCYEVNSGLQQYFPNFIFRSKDRFYLDLIKVTFSQLSEAGIAKENIIDSALCTKCNKTDLFSFRGQDQKNRMLSFVALK